MSTLTAAPDSLVPTAAAPRRERVSFARLTRAEWIKFTTLRSTWWAFALVAAVSIGLSFLQATSMARFADVEAPNLAAANAEAVGVVVFVTVLTQLLAVILGTISVTGEYSTGMIRSTLTADPQRVGAMLAKALVAGGAMFIFSLIVFAVQAAVTGPMLPWGPIDFSDLDTSLMPILGAALYLALITMMGVGIGFIIRNGPGALAVGIGLLFVLPVIVMFFPPIPDTEWIYTLASYLPSNAGQSLFMGQPLSGETLQLWPALLTIVAWAVGTLAIGAGVLKSRDA